MSQLQLTVSPSLVPALLQIRWSLFLPSLLSSPLPDHRQRHLANPIDINTSSAIAEIAAAGGVPVTHDGSMLGNGTTGNPLGVTGLLRLH